MGTTWRSPSITTALFSLLLGVTTLVPMNALAIHPLITDDSGTLGKGKFQLEFTGEYGEDRQRFVKNHSLAIQATLLYGVIDTIDIVLSFPYETSREYRYPWLALFDHHPEGVTYLAWTSGDPLTQLPLLRKTRTVTGGIADNAVEVKWRFYEISKVSFIFKPTVTFPIGDTGAGLGAGRMTFCTVFGTTIDLDPVSIHLNLGYRRKENSINEKKDLWSTSLAILYRPVKNLQLGIDGGIARNPARGSRLNRVMERGDREKTARTDPAFIMGGIIYSITNNFDIDAGVKYGLTRTEVDYTALAGIIIRF